MDGSADGIKFLIEGPFTLAKIDNPGFSVGVHIGLHPPCLDIFLPGVTFSFMDANAADEIRIAQRVDAGELISDIVV